MAMKPTSHSLQATVDDDVFQWVKDYSREHGFISHSAIVKIALAHFIAAQEHKPPPSSKSALARTRRVYRERKKKASVNNVG